MKEKLSYGVACVKCFIDGPRILLVKRKYTFNYFAFVSGRYNATDDAEIIGMLSQTTRREKQLIIQLNFDMLWSSVWDAPSKTAYGYVTAVDKFTSAFCSDGGARLRRLVSNSTSVRLPWEIPKGRRCMDETPIAAAMREFVEETTVDRKSYLIVPDCVFSYETVDGDVLYSSVLYLGLMRPSAPIDEYGLIDTHDLGDARSTRWFSAAELKTVTIKSDIVTVCKKALRAGCRRWKVRF